MQFLGLNWFEEGLRYIMAWLCQLIYPIITWLYDLFVYVSKVNILSDDMVQPIYQRVTLILTIVMVFYVTFEFIKYVVQPDGITDKEKGAGKIIYRMIAVVVLIAFVPNIFTAAYELQTAIVERDVIGKVVLGNRGTIEDNFGGNFSASIFSMFYSVNEEYVDDDTECDGIPCKALVGMNLKSLSENGHLKYLTKGINEATDKAKVDAGGYEGKATVAYINFDGLFAVIVGAFIVYILVLYCIDVGVRWAQLVFLQIIAPIPIIGYLAPKKDGIFEKWCKQCLTTYLDLFIRIAIINFVLLICGLLLDQEVLKHLFSNLEGISDWMKAFVVIVLVLGLLLFAQKAPKLLGELFPKMGAASGNFGLKAGERVAPMAARAIGAGAGGLNRLVKGGIAKAANTRKRNNEIRERRRAAGKDTSRKAVRQERRQAALDERAAKRKNAQARKASNQLDKNTKTERNAVLDAEKELAAAKRSGNEDRIKAASKKLENANNQLQHKKAEIQATKEKRMAEQQLNQAKASGNKSAIDAAQKNYDNASQKLTAIQEKSQREGKVSDATKDLEKHQATVNQLAQDREAKDKAVEDAQQKLNDAKASGDPNAIAQAENDLTNAIQARDNSLDIYNQDQIIKTNTDEINQKQAEITQNNQLVANAESQHSAATTAVNEAQSKLDNATIQGDKDIAAAEAALAAAKSSGDKAQEQLAQQAVNQAIVNKNIAVSKAQTELNDAQSKAASTQNALNTAKSTRDTNNARLQSEIATAQSNLSTATNARKQAVDIRDRDYTRAVKSKKAAEDLLESEQAELRNSETAVQEYSGRAKENYDASQAEYATAQSARAEIQNQRYRSTVAAGATGSLAGGWRGFTTGAQATKLEDISKKVAEGAKKDREALAASEKWLDSGGTTLTSKIASSIDKNIGVMTDAQVSEMQTKNYDTQIAANKRISAVEGSVKTNVDNAKSRSGSKVEAGEQKTNVELYKDKQGNFIPITYKDSSGKNQVLVDENSAYLGKKTSEVYEAEKNKAKTAREKAQAAQQAYASAKAQGNVSAERLLELEKAADDASNKATREEQMLGQKKKVLEEYAITHVLQTDPNLRRNKVYEPDQVLVEQVENSLQSVEETKRNQDTYNKMIIELGKIDQANGTNYTEAYRTGNIKDFDTLDTIQATLNTIKAQRDRDNTTLETMAGILKASSKLDAEKAADGATGNK